MMASGRFSDHGLTKLRPQESSCADTKMCHSYSECSSRGTRRRPRRTSRWTVSQFVEAASLFADPLAALLEDALDPESVIQVAESEERRVLLVVYQEESEDTIRIIS